MKSAENSLLSINTDLTDCEIMRRYPVFARKHIKDRSFIETMSIHRRIMKCLEDKQ